MPSCTRLKALFGRHSFEKELQEMSAMTYPRELRPAYLELLRCTSASRSQPLIF
jgi:hypothetical protein